MSLELYGAALSWTLAVLLFLGGLAGTILPVIPGPPLVFLGLLVAAWIDDFERVGWIPLVGLGLLTLFTLAIDLASASVGARKLEASRWAALGAAVGTVVGLFFGLIGIVLGPFAGAVAGQYWYDRDLRKAGKVGAGAWLGMVLGSALKLAVVFVMVGWFAAAFTF